MLSDILISAPPSLLPPLPTGLTHMLLFIFKAVLLTGNVPTPKIPQSQDSVKSPPGNPVIENP